MIGKNLSETKHNKGAKQAAKESGGKLALEKIAAMQAPFNTMGERLHALILRSAPQLQPTVWYGMPAYAKDGKTVCFFRSDKKYMTFGFTQDANLTPDATESHQLIPSAWYFTGLDEATESALAAIVGKLAPQ